MAKYRKKPVIVDATQWHQNGDHPLDYSKDHSGFVNGEFKDVALTAEERRQNGFEGDIVRYYRHPDVPGETPCVSSIPCGFTMHDHGWIDTPEGGHTVCPGDWIITGVKNEKYPCKPIVFAMTYEAVE